MDLEALARTVKSDQLAQRFQSVVRAKKRLRFDPRGRTVRGNRQRVALVHAELRLEQSENKANVQLDAVVLDVDVHRRQRSRARRGGDVASVRRGGGNVASENLVHVAIDRGGHVRVLLIGNEVETVIVNADRLVSSRIALGHWPDGHIGFSANMGGWA